MGFTHISEDSSEIAFLLVENYNHDHSRLASAGLGIFGTKTSSRLETFIMLFFIASGLLWADVKKNRGGRERKRREEEKKRRLHTGQEEVEDHETQDVLMATLFCRGDVVLLCCCVGRFSIVGIRVHAMQCNQATQYTEIPHQSCKCATVSIPVPIKAGRSRTTLFVGVLCIHPNPPSYSLHTIQYGSTSQHHNHTYSHHDQDGTHHRRNWPTWQTSLESVRTRKLECGWHRFLTRKASCHSQSRSRLRAGSLQSVA